MLRHPALLVAAALTFTPCVVAQDRLTTASREQLDVSKVIIQQRDAWDRGDLDAYLSFYKDAPDTVAVLAQPVHGLKSIQSAFHAAFPSRDAMGTLEEDAVEVRELGDNFALITGHYALVRPRKFGGDAMGTFLNIMEKTSSGWKIIYSQNN